MPPTHQPELFFLFCNAEGIRLTVKCKVLLRVLCESDCFMDAESLWLLMKNKGQQISRATVYKRLNWLCSKGYTLQKQENSAAKLYRLVDLDLVMNESSGKGSIL